ncbi:hypothetical protein L6172_17680 [Thalassospiraceae bacterium SW-3-3]|nr:hypothetical protein L6172_17680 [Thalassospiraceae bacterium SW-3-3]
MNGEADKSYMGTANPGAGIADVERFFAGLKMVFGLVAIGIWAFTAFYFLEPDDPNDQWDSYYRMQGMSKWEQKVYFLGYFGYGYLWGEHPVWGRGYFEACVKEQSYGCSAETTPLEFVLLQIEDEPDDYIRMLIFFAFWFCLAFGYFLMRKPAPVRFNRNLGAIYTWYDGKLWIHFGERFHYDYKPGSDLLSGKAFNGPMRIKLHSSTHPKRKKTFKLGTYPYPCEAYGDYLGRDLQAFMRGAGNRTEKYSPKTLRYPWWHRSLLGKKELPGDIDKRAADWVMMHAGEQNEE